MTGHVNPHSDLPAEYQENMQEWHPDDLLDSPGVFRYALLPRDSPIKGYVSVGRKIVGAVTKYSIRRTL